MKYYKSSRFPRFIGSTGFLALLACALIAIGVAVWFGVSNNRAEEKTPKTESRTENTPSYDEPTPSYNSSTIEQEMLPDNGSMTDVKNEVSSVPYETEESEEDENVATVPEKKSFVLPFDGAIIKDYSDTALQFSATYSDMRLHTGIDIACPKGSDINAVAGGTVIATEESSSLGKTVTVDHGEGITVKYCGLDSIAVRKGDGVTSGMLIGTSGTVPCECADQSHVHIEVFENEKSVSPLKALGLE